MSNAEILNRVADSLREALRAGSPGGESITHEELESAYVQALARDVDVGSESDALDRSPVAGALGMIAAIPTDSLQSGIWVFREDAGALRDALLRRHEHLDTPVEEVPIVGIPASVSKNTRTAPRLVGNADFVNPDEPGTGRVDRGYLRVRVEPALDGAVVYVTSRHAAHDDIVSLSLVAEVFDRKANALRTVTLTALVENENLNGDKFRAVRAFSLSYDAINAYLQARNANLSITPGVTNLAVFGQWKNQDATSNRHIAGGFGRGGEFRLPPRVGQKTSTPSSRTAGPVSLLAKTDAPPLPLDMQVAFPEALLRENRDLKRGGHITSRLESELKGVATDVQRLDATRAMYAMAEEAATAGDRAASRIVQLLGSDWTIEPVRRYWLKDAGAPSTSANRPGVGYFAGFRVGADGLPLQDPMSDVYSDDSTLSVTGRQGAIRVRTNAAATVINVKPDGGRVDTTTGIRQRIEVGIELEPRVGSNEAMRVLQFLETRKWARTVFNHVRKLLGAQTGNTRTTANMSPWVRVDQERHKFVVKNLRTQVEVELSFDKVTAETLRSGMQLDDVPRRAEFSVFEAELDHLQLASANQAVFEAGNGPSTREFQTNEAQDGWLKASSADVTMNIDPRLHENEDLEDDGFRETASYRAFEMVISRMVPAIFPDGLQPGMQKSAHAARVMGVRAFDDAAVVAGARKVIERGGYAWTAELEAFISQAMNDDDDRAAMEAALIREPDNVQRWAGALGVTPPLSIDPAMMVARFRRFLLSRGYEGSKALDRLVTIAAPKVDPLKLGLWLSVRRGITAPAAVRQMSGLAGIVPAPTLKSNIDYLLGPTGKMGRHVRRLLKNAEVKAVGGPAAIDDFLRALHKAGASIETLTTTLQRSRISDFDAKLDVIARQHGMTKGLPTYIASAELLKKRLEGNISSHIVTTAEAVDVLVRALVSSGKGREVLIFAARRDLSIDVLESKAAELGVGPLGLKADYRRFDATAAQALKSKHVLYDGTSLQSYAHALLDLGAKSSDVIQALRGGRGKAPFGHSLLRRLVRLPDSPLPKLKYDMDAVERTIRSSSALRGHDFFGFSSDMRAYAQQVLSQGLNSNSIGGHLRSAWRLSRRSADRSYRLAALPPQVSPTPLPVDVDRVVAHWAERFKAVSNGSIAWDPGVEARVRKALAGALKDPTFVFGLALRQNNLAALIATLEKHAS